MGQMTEPDPLASRGQVGPEANVEPTRLELVTASAQCLSNGNIKGLGDVATELRALSRNGFAPRGGLWSLYERHRYVGLLSGYCELLLHLDKTKDDANIAAALIGIANVRAGNMGAAMAILRNLKFHLVPGESILYVMKGLFIFSVIASLSAYTAVMVLHTRSTGGIQHQTLNVLVSFIFGLLGSVVSLLSRIPQFEQISGRSQRYCFYTGATAPVVGGISAAVVACLIQSKIITFEAVDFSANSSFFVVLGFLAGFSERFSGNLLRVAQTRIVPADDARTRPQEFGARPSTEAGAQTSKIAKEA